eukprot:CFRG3251T1
MSSEGSASAPPAVQTTATSNIRLASASIASSSNTTSNTNSQSNIPAAVNSQSSTNNRKRLGAHGRKNSSNGRNKTRNGISSGSRKGDGNAVAETEAEADNEESGGITQCVCEFVHDDEHMIACDKCNNWQHTVCMGLQPSTVPSVYYCSRCSPRPIDVTRAKVIQAKKAEELRALEESKQKRKEKKEQERILREQRRKNKQRQKERDKAEGGDVSEYDDGHGLESDDNNQDMATENNRLLYDGAWNITRGCVVRADVRDVCQGWGISESMSGSESDSLERGEDVVKRLIVCMQKFEAGAIDSGDERISTTSSSSKTITRKSTPSSSTKNDTMVSLVTDRFLGKTFQKALYMREGSVVAAGETITEYSGLVRFSEGFVREWEKSDVYSTTKRMCPYVAFLREEVCVDARKYGGIARCVRRSCHANAEVVVVASHVNASVGALVPITPSSRHTSNDDTRLSESGGKSEKPTAEGVGDGNDDGTESVSNNGSSTYIGDIKSLEVRKSVAAREGYGASPAPGLAQSGVQVRLVATSEIRSGEEVTIPFDYNYDDTSYICVCACGLDDCIVLDSHRLKDLRRRLKAAHGLHKTPSVDTPSMNSQRTYANPNPHAHSHSKSHSHASTHSHARTHLHSHHHHRHHQLHSNRYGSESSMSDTHVSDVLKTPRGRRLNLEERKLLAIMQTIKRMERSEMRKRAHKDKLKESRNASGSASASASVAVTPRTLSPQHLGSNYAQLTGDTSAVANEDHVKMTDIMVGKKSWIRDFRQEESQNTNSPHKFTPTSRTAFNDMTFTADAKTNFTAHPHATHPHTTSPVSKRASEHMANFSDTLQRRSPKADPEPVTTPSHRIHTPLTHATNALISASTNSSPVQIIATRSVNDSVLNVESSANITTKLKENQIRLVSSDQNASEKSSTSTRTGTGSLFSHELMNKDVGNQSTLMLRNGENNMTLEAKKMESLSSNISSTYENSQTQSHTTLHTSAEKSGIFGVVSKQERNIEIEGDANRGVKGSTDSKTVANTLPASAAERRAGKDAHETPHSESYVPISTTATSSAPTDVPCNEIVKMEHVTPAKSTLTNAPSTAEPSTPKRTFRDLEQTVSTGNSINENNTSGLSDRTEYKKQIINPLGISSSASTSTLAHISHADIGLANEDGGYKKDPDESPQVSQNMSPSQLHLISVSTSMLSSDETSSTAPVIPVKVVVKDERSPRSARASGSMDSIDNNAVEMKMSMHAASVQGNVDGTKSSFMSTPTPSHSSTFTSTSVSTPSSVSTSVPKICPTNKQSQNTTSHAVTDTSINMAGKQVSPKSQSTSSAASIARTTTQDVIPTSMAGCDLKVKLQARKDRFSTPSALHLKASNKIAVPTSVSISKSVPSTPTQTSLKSLDTPSPSLVATQQSSCSESSSVSTDILDKRKGGHAVKTKPENERHRRTSPHSQVQLNIQQQPQPVDASSLRDSSTSNALTGKEVNSKTQTVRVDASVLKDTSMSTTTQTSSHSAASATADAGANACAGGGSVADGEGGAEKRVAGIADLATQQLPPVEIKKRKLTLSELTSRNKVLRESRQ